MIRIKTEIMIQNSSNIWLNIINNFEFFIFYLKACNNKNCGFDLGDCGLNNFKDIYRIDLDEASDKEMLFELPTETTLFYVNFTNLFSNKSEFNIIKAEYEENDLVRKISIINKLSCQILQSE